MPPTEEKTGEATPMINTSFNSKDRSEKTYDLSPSEATIARPHAFTDALSEMTNGRRFAQRISNSLCFGRCYNPNKNKVSHTIPANEEEGREEQRVIAPNLDKGWEFFEHYVLPRCFVNPPAEMCEGKKFYRAEPGEAQDKTRLYPIWGTPLEDMADFGIGVGMYFDMIRFFAVVALIAGFMSIPSILFYMSEDYSADGKKGIGNTLNRGSAICTNAYWQPCPTCAESDFETWPSTAYGRVITGTSPKQTNVTFVMTNNCEVNDTFAIMNLATMLFFTVATFVFLYLQRRMRARLDEGEQTTADYSIRIRVSFLLWACKYLFHWIFTIHLHCQSYHMHAFYYMRVEPSS